MLTSLSDRMQAQAQVADGVSMGSAAPGSDASSPSAPPGTSSDGASSSGGTPKSSSSLAPSPVNPADAAEEPCDADGLDNFLRNLARIVHDVEQRGGISSDQF